MAYIPPHKRHTSSATPTPPPSFNTQKSNSRQPRFNRKEKQKKNVIVFAKGAISRWFHVGLSAEDYSQLSLITHLQPLDRHTLYQESNGQKPLVLVLNDHALQAVEGGEATAKFLADPWAFIAENVRQDLFSALERVKKNIEEVKPELVARIGKILFYRGKSSSEDPIGSGSLDEDTLRNLKRIFATNVPTSYLDYVINVVGPKLGFCLKSVKDVYYVKLVDNTKTDRGISCKCTETDDKKIELRKVELEPQRQFVADMSCLDKNYDLRLMARGKKIATSLTDDELEMIRHLISYAIIDPTVKGGIRWPLGKDFTGDRYTLVGIWHATSELFESSSRIRMKVRHADRFDFRSSTGEDAREVTFKLHGILSQLREETVQSDLVSVMLRDHLRYIWEYCLNGPIL